MLGGTELQTGDGVDDEGEDEGDDEGVGGDGDDIGDLDVELLPVLVDPAPVDDTGVDAVKTNDVVCAKQTVEDETDHTSDAVLSEHIHGVVNVNHVFDCCVAC